MKFPNIDPEIIGLKLGSFNLSIRWYSMMYVLGFVLGGYMAKLRRKRGLFQVSLDAAESLITYLIIGLILGARIFYVFVYNWDYYSKNFSEIIQVWNGGLSFHGAIIGMLIACALFAKKNKVPFYMVSDTFAYIGGWGIFFGRIGNFINGELYGRETTVSWGMVFPNDPLALVRHPSQIYQALLEGLAVWFILHFYQAYQLKRNTFRHGFMGAWFLIFYGLFRFLVEYTREPDAQLGYYFGGSLTMGQILCLIMIAAGFGVYWHANKLNLTLRKWKAH